MITVKICAEGDQVCAMIGENLQEGIAGFGDNISGALKELAAEVEKNSNTLIMLILREMSTQLQESRREPRQRRGGDGGDEHIVADVVEFKSGGEKPAPPKAGAGVELPNISDREFVDAFVKHIHPDGIPCDRCFSGKGTVNEKNPKKYICGSCGKSGSVFKGTIFSHSQQPLAAWAALIRMMKQPDIPTIAQVQKELGVRYDTAKPIMNKVDGKLNDNKYRPFFSEIEEMVENSPKKMKPMGSLR